MLFRSILALAVLALVFAAVSAKDCTNQAPGRYCSSSTTFDWCYSSGPSVTLQCPMGTQCLCSYVADGNPCGLAGQESTIPGCTGAGSQPPQNPQNPPKPPQQPPQPPQQPQQPPQQPQQPPKAQAPAQGEKPPLQPIKPVNPGSCSVSSVNAAGSSKKLITYFTNWAQYRPGNCKFEVSMIQGNLYTHINFAFAMVDGNSFAVVPHDPADITDAANGVPKGMYEQVNSLKAKYPHLKTLISLGGWSFGATIFSKMASSAANRAAFISSAIAFARKHNFDGVDIDWEYPAHGAQGGRPEDTINFSSLLREFRAAIESENRGNKDKLLLTIASPAGASVMAGLQLNVIHQYLDWINLMTYDMHGAWDATVGFHTPLYCPSGDTLCIDYAVDAYLKAGTPSHKLVLGLGTYGRSWTLANPANTNPGAAANGGGQSGTCTGEAGIMSYYEIKDFLASGATEKYDALAVAQYAYKGNQWVSYDSPATIKSKIEYANAKALGGAMVWALDLDAPKGSFHELQCTAAAGLHGPGASTRGDNFNSENTFQQAEHQSGVDRPGLVPTAILAYAIVFALAALC